MVKIRADKVFLDAVENEIMRIAGVKQAAAVAWMDPSNHRQLIAYVALTAPGAVSARAIQARVRETLPEHCVPSLIIELPELPATSQGKIDRRALPEPAWHERASVKTVEPRTAIERMIAAIWAQVLHLDAVGITERFIDLGGDSLQAGRVAAGIKATCGIDIGPAFLLDSSTVADTASAVADAIARRAAATHRRS